MVCDFDCLYIEVLPSGVKSWVYRRQDRKGGKTVKKVLGRYPEMSLYNARLGRNEARDALNKVQMDRELSKTQPTFMELAEEWLDKKCRPSSLRKTSIEMTRSRKSDGLVIFSHGRHSFETVTRSSLSKSDGLVKELTWSSLSTRTLSVTAFDSLPPREGRTFSTP